MWWIWLLGIIIVVLFGYGYNKIINLENRAKKAWSDIDVYLKRVSELVPNLVNVTKGYAKYEKGIIEKVSEAYTKIMQAPKFAEKVKEASNMMNLIYPIVYQVPEYPDLKATQEFSNLMEELRVAMDKIAYSRQFYNQAVFEYNTFIQSLPWVIIAKILSKKELPLFEYKERKEVQRKLEEGDYTKELSEI